MYCPTVNSYKRLVEGYWAPVQPTWGVENRTTSLRVIPGSEFVFYLINVIIILLILPVERVPDWKLELLVLMQILTYPSLQLLLLDCMVFDTNCSFSCFNYFAKFLI